MSERSELVAPCGIDCGICELYLSRNDAALMDFLVSRGIPREVLPCDGCRSIEGACPVIGGTCATFECATSKNVSFCSECDEFPCAKLAPVSDRAGELPHNMKLFNLCIVDRHGVEELTRRSGAIKQAYYKGKMRIGEGPVIEPTE